MTGFAWGILSHVFETMSGIGLVGSAVVGFHDFVEKSCEEKAKKDGKALPVSTESKEETTSDDKKEPEKPEEK